MWKNVRSCGKNKRSMREDKQIPDSGVGLRGKVARKMRRKRQREDRMKLKGDKNMKVNLSCWKLY